MKFTNYNFFPENGCFDFYKKLISSTFGHKTTLGLIYSLVSTTISIFCRVKLNKCL